MKAEQIKHNIATGRLTAKQHTWEAAKQYGLDEGIRNIAAVFSISAVEIVKGGQIIARWQK